MRRLAERIAKRLHEIDAAGLRRRLRAPVGIDLSSNDYLGLANDPRVTHAFAEAILREGSGSAGSRLLRGHRDAFSRIEEEVAAWKSTAASLYCSTGYAANLSALTALTEPGDVIFTDEKNHASLIDGMRLSKAQRVIFRHNDVDHLERSLREHEGAQKFVVVESLYSMDGDFAPLHDMAALCRAHDAALIVDEAHACGIYGTSGSGYIEECGVEQDVFLSVNAAGKALGVSGAFLCGSEDAIDLVINRARPFIFSTAPPPAVADAIRTSIRIVRSEPERRESLKAKARLMRQHLLDAGGEVVKGESQIIAVIIGDNLEAVDVAEQLQHEGFDVRAVRPPTVPHGTARLRISVNSKIDDRDVLRFAESAGRALRSVSS